MLAASPFEVGYSLEIKHSKRQMRSLEVVHEETQDLKPLQADLTTRWCPNSLAKLVYKSNVTMVFVGDISN